MNLGALLILLKLVGDIGVLPTEVGPPPPPVDVEYTEIKPICGPGKYAYKHPDLNIWTCLPIPKGR